MSGRCLCGARLRAGICSVAGCSASPSGFDLELWGPSWSPHIPPIRTTAAQFYADNEDEPEMVERVLRELAEGARGTITGGGAQPRVYIWRV